MKIKIIDREPENSAFIIIPRGSVFEPTGFDVYGMSVTAPETPPEHYKWFPLLQASHPELKVLSWKEVPRGRIEYRKGKYALYMWDKFYEIWDREIFINAINNYFRLKVDPYYLYADPWGDYKIDLSVLDHKIKNMPPGGNL